MNLYLKYSLISVGCLTVLGGISYFVYYQYKQAEGTGEVSARTKFGNRITFSRN